MKRQDINLLLALEENPQGTVRDLASMSGISMTKAFSILKKFEDKKNLNLSVSAIPNYTALGLKNVHVLIKIQYQKIEILQDIIKDYPFIVFQAEIFGDFNGLWIEFDIPVDSSEEIKKLFRILKNRGYIENFQLFEFDSKISYSQLKIENMNLDTLLWEFSWEKWLNEHVELFQDIENPLNSFKKIKIWLKCLDVAVLGEIRFNVRRKNKFIIEALKEPYNVISGATFSRRLKNLKMKCIDSQNLCIDLKIVCDMTRIFLWGYADERILQEINSRMKISPIPFESKFNVNRKNFYWFLQLPSYQISDFLHYFKSIIPELHVNFIDFSRSQRFMINPEAWNENSNMWIMPKIVFPEKKNDY